MQGGFPIEARGMHIGAAGEQRLHRVQAAFGRGRVQGRFTVVPLCIHIGAGGKQFPHALHIAVARGDLQCLGVRRRGCPGVHGSLGLSGILPARPCCKALAE